MELLNLPLAIVELGVVTVKVVILTLIASIKACLPMGWIPKKNVEGSYCLITGAGSGLGQRMAYEFARLGCHLILWDINEGGNEETRRECVRIGRRGLRVTTYTVDLSDRFDIRRAADLVKKEEGRVDILINNAGIVSGKKLTDCTEEEIERTMAVNCLAGIFTTRHFLEGMINNGSGHIVTIASIAGKLGTAGLVDYCASKYAAVGFHESLTEEIRARGVNEIVKTTLVCPYYTNTGMFAGAQTHAPLLLPFLDPAYVVDAIMEAVLTDRQELFLPKFLYFATVSFALFPNSVNAVLLDYFRINQTMSGFTGRRVQNN